MPLFLLWLNMYFMQYQSQWDCICCLWIFGCHQHTVVFHFFSYCYFECCKCWMIELTLKQINFCCYHTLILWIFHCNFTHLEPRLKWIEPYLDFLCLMVCTGTTSPLTMIIKEKGRCFVNTKTSTVVFRSILAVILLRKCFLWMSS